MVIQWYYCGFLYIKCKSIVVCYKESNTDLLLSVIEYQREESLGIYWFCVGNMQELRIETQESRELSSVVNPSGLKHTAALST